MVYLDVPYAEKDEAKALGAAWDPVKKKWYVPDWISPKKLARWLPKSAMAPKRHVIKPRLHKGGLTAAQRRLATELDEGFARAIAKD